MPSRGQYSTSVFDRGDPSLRSKIEFTRERNTHADSRARARRGPFRSRRGRTTPMPRRTDIHSILIIGSGPIVIGQGCEFDYSGVQACRALKEEGYRIVLINSNPATIMTDPEFADATYIEPITPEAVEKILIREAASGHPIDALLPTLGGQTGLNTGMACFDKGILQKYSVQMIGADREAIFRGEDRQVFKDLMIEIGLKVPRSGVVHTIEEARKVLEDISL